MKLLFLEECFGNSSLIRFQKTTLSVVIVIGPR
jgi:hypothetical protein